MDVFLDEKGKVNILRKVNIEGEMLSSATEQWELSYCLYFRVL
jgi:hypothetical protein